jgi:hypothetical protein
MNYDGYINWQELWNDSNTEIKDLSLDEESERLIKIFHLGQSVLTLEKSECVSGEDDYNIVWCSESTNTNESDSVGDWYSFTFVFDDDMNLKAVEYDN